MLHWDGPKGYTLAEFDIGSAVERDSGVGNAVDIDVVFGPTDDELVGIETSGDVVHGLGEPCDYSDNKNPKVKTKVLLPCFVAVGGHISDDPDTDSDVNRAIRFEGAIAMTNKLWLVWPVKNREGRLACE